MRGKSGNVLSVSLLDQAASMRPAHYAREVLPSFLVGLTGAIASMRPAHYAREVGPIRAKPRQIRLASMRPAHYAREVQSKSAKIRYLLDASMRPAHYAREVLLSAVLRSCCAGRFNEARALCAGSPPCQGRANGESPRASMRPAHYAREVSLAPHAFTVVALASMRPAHYAREVNRLFISSASASLSFNEARALCAGSRTLPHLDSAAAPPLQ